MLEHEQKSMFRLQVNMCSAKENKAFSRNNFYKMLQSENG